MADAPLPPGTTPGRLGDKIERTLMRFLLRAYNSTIGLVSSRLRAGLDRWMEQLEGVMVEWYGPLLDEILASPSLTPGIRHLLERVRHPTSQLGGIVAAAAAGSAASGVIGGAVNPITRAIGHMIDVVVHSAVPDPATLSRLMWRGAFGNTRYDQLLQQLGIPNEMRPGMEAINRPRLSPSDLYSHQRRFGSSAVHVRTLLEHLGYTGEAIDKLGDLTKFSPGPGDLVSMGVREAWRDDVAARWGYDADFPAQFAVEMKRLGDEEGWAQKFWRAHWTLPSVTLGLEMLHRDAITLDEFRELLRISDIPAGWRARIEKVAYLPYTRVDTRRMYRFGVLDEDEVYRTYRDLGYDEEHATNMSLFAILDATEEERSITKTDILSGYRLGRMSTGEARTALIECGYNPWVADVQIANVDTKRSNELAQTRISHVKTLFVANEITRSRAVAELAAIPLSGAEIDRYIVEWDLTRETRIKRPSRSSLDDFYLRDIITQSVYEEVMGSIGYSPGYVSWYLAALTVKKAESAAREAERARTEQESIEKRTVTTAYQRDKALLSVDTREVETAIAETQVALQARRDRYQADRALATEAISVETLRRSADGDIDRIQGDIDASTLEIDGLDIEIDARETEIARIREAILGVPEGTQIDALEAEIAHLRVEIEGIQDTIAGQRVIVTEHRITISEADVPAEVVSLTDEIDTLSVEIGGGYVLIDELQTDIARWMEAAYTTEDVERIDTIRSDILHARVQIETIQDIVAEHRVAITTAKARLRVLEVPEPIQASIRDIDALTIAIGHEQVQIESIQTAIAEHRAQIEQEDRTDRDDEILLQIATLERQNEESQDAIRLLERDRTVARADLRRRRGQLERDVAHLERVRNVVLVERQYDEDIADINRRLGELRLNLMELREQLATLAVEYRTGLVR